MLVRQKYIAFNNAEPIDFHRVFATISINIHLRKIKFNSANVYSAHNKWKICARHWGRQIRLKLSLW